MPSAESASADKNATVKMNARSSNRPSGIESVKSGTGAEIPGRQDVWGFAKQSINSGVRVLAPDGEGQAGRFPLRRRSDPLF